MNYELRPLHASFAAGDEGRPAETNPDRSRLLLEFNNAVIMQLDLESMLRSIFDCVKQAFRQTIAATLSIYDSQSNQLRIHLLHSPESEFFGHEKGAFTGPIAQRIGRFELAHKGTLLLDEIGEIPLELQPKLLRVLQEQEFERLGSARTIKADVRLVASTNCDLRQMVLEKRFRSDLFYRLNVFPVTVPPLRERAEDIPLLSAYFTQKHSRRMNKRIHIVPRDTMLALQSYHWPGNVRELENFTERAVILSRGSELQAPLLELKLNAPVSGEGAALISMEEMERSHIEKVLRHTNGIIAGKAGAEILSMPASTLRGRMKKLGIKSALPQKSLFHSHRA